jgi:prolipoprotein diacylglyceryltransferase
MILGRIGCFTAGVYEQTYGLPTSLPWALNLGDGIGRHPVTLYEIAFLITLWIVLYRASVTYVLEKGALFKMFMISYLLFRFLLDFIKPGWRYAFGLGSIQLACLAGLIYYSPFILKPRLLLSTS